MSSPFPPLLTALPKFQPDATVKISLLPTPVASYRWGSDMETEKLAERRKDMLNFLFGVFLGLFMISLFGIMTIAAAEREEDGIRKRTEH